MKISRTNSDDPDFIRLVLKLDKILSLINGEDHSFYNQFNGLDAIGHAVLIYSDDEAVACGAFKHYDAITCEVKRMFTLPEHRGKGFAGMLVDELEKWAKESGYESVVLETSVKLENAIRLYKRKGYSLIDNYGPYANAVDSVCFKKTISGT